RELLIQPWFSLRACFPSAMDPEPLVRRFANRSLDRGLNAPRVVDRVARDFNFRIEAQNVTVLALAPESESRNHRRAASPGKPGEGEVGAGELSKKRHERPVIRRRVLIHQDTDGLV